MKICTKSLTFAVFLILGNSIAAQGQTPTPSPTPAPPAADIFIVEVKNDRNGTRFGQPAKITTFVGYNNQPSFLPGGKSILYTSIRDKQADIYRYDLRSGATTQITNTPESEFSP